MEDVRKPKRKRGVPPGKIFSAKAAGEIDSKNAKRSHARLSRQVGGMQRRGGGRRCSSMLGGRRWDWTEKVGLDDSGTSRDKTKLKGRGRGERETLFRT